MSGRPASCSSCQAGRAGWPSAGSSSPGTRSPTGHHQHQPPPTPSSPARSPPPPPRLHSYPPNVLLGGLPSGWSSGSSLSSGGSSCSGSSSAGSSAASSPAFSAPAYRSRPLSKMSRSSAKPYLAAPGRLSTWLPKRMLSKLFQVIARHRFDSMLLIPYTLDTIYPIHLGFAWISCSGFTSIDCASVCSASPARQTSSLLGHYASCPARDIRGDASILHYL